MKNTRVIWRCKKCKDYVISYSHLRHQMNYCECGESALDLEQHYARLQGSVEYINVKEHNGKEWVKLRSV